MGIKGLIKNIALELFAVSIISLPFLGGCHNEDRVRDLAIYYGWPSYINGSKGDVDEAYSHFEPFDVIVFGNTLNENSHPEYMAVSEIISMLHEESEEREPTDVFGYIDLGVTTSNLTEEQINESIYRWELLDVDGIFYDCASPAYGVDIERLGYGVDSAKDKNLDVFINCDDLKWLKSSKIIKKGDKVLIEPIFYFEGKSWPTNNLTESIIRETKYEYYGVSAYDPGQSIETRLGQYVSSLERAKMIGLSGIAFTHHGYASFGPEKNVLIDYSAMLDE